MTGRSPVVVTKGPLDEVVEADRLARDSDRKQFLAGPELLGRILERLEHTEAQLTLEVHASDKHRRSRQHNRKRRRVAERGEVCGSCRIGKAERVPAIATHVLGIAAAAGHESDPVRREEADQRMPDFPRHLPGLEERVPAEARALDEAVALRHLMDAVAEQAATIADFLGESPAFGEGVRRGGEHQRMAAPDAHILVVPCPVPKAFIGVVAQEARQRVPDACERAVFAQVVGATPAAALAGRRVMERAVVDCVTPEPAAEVTNELGVGHTRKCARRLRLGSRRPGNIFFVLQRYESTRHHPPGNHRAQGRATARGRRRVPDPRASKPASAGRNFNYSRVTPSSPGVPGHEFVGVVEQAPEADSAWIGRRVVGEINVGCRHCDWCAREIKEHCANRNVVGIRQRDGAFAEYLSLPAVNLHAVPETMDDETAVFAEPVAAACRIFEQMTVDPQARVAIVGDGRMGLLVAQVLRTVAPDVTVSDGTITNWRLLARLACPRSPRTDSRRRRLASTSSST